MNDREHLRIDQQVSIVIDFFEKKAHGYEPMLLLCDSLDISAGGFKAQVDKALVEMAIYSIALKVANETFQLVAQVKWVESLKDNKDHDSYCVGFQLLDSEGTDIIAFKQWFAYQHSLKALS